MSLENKNAIVYGAGGAIGSEVAKAFARAGARVYVTGRTRRNLTPVVKAIKAEGGWAKANVVDATNEAAVERHAKAVVAESGSVDVSINLIRVQGVQGVPLVDMLATDVLAPVELGLRSNFITARAAAKHMTEQGSGVIIALNSGSGNGSPMMGGTGPADAALDVLVRNLAAEIGPAGVRVVGIWTAGLPETITKEKMAEHGIELSDEAFQGMLANLDGMRMTKKSPRLAEVAGTAAFLASDNAGAITGTFVNVTSGTFPS